MSVKLSKALRNNAFNDPTKETVQKSIGMICSEVNANKMIMPIFQRTLSWTTTKKIELFNFQLNGFAPVSPISMNKVGNKSMDMPHVTLINRLEMNNLSGGELSIIDGQQRISTNYQAYINDDSIRDIALDLTKGVFFNLKDKDIKKNQIPVGILYNKDPEVFTDYIGENSSLAVYNVSSLLGQIRTKFFNYFYTINFAQDLSGDEQIQWFDVLNLAGSRVPDVQMRLTRLQIKGLDFYKEYSNVVQEKFETCGLSDLFIQKSTEVSIPLAMLNPSFEVVLGKPHVSNACPIASDVLFSKSIVTIIDPEDLKVCFERTLGSLERAFEFIDENDLSTPTRIDYITYLTGYFVYNENPSASNIKSLIKWYNEIDFANSSNKKRRDAFSDLLKL